jgi:hypothetical protein
MQIYGRRRAATMELRWLAMGRGAECGDGGGGLELERWEQREMEAALDGGDGDGGGGLELERRE